MIRELVLNSTSPRRQKLLQEAGYKFRCHPVKVSEIIDETLNPAAQVLALSKKKAKAFVQAHKPPELKGILLLSADTMVVFQNRAMGKPRSTEEAGDFLRTLSGKQHRVLTAVDLRTFDSDTRIELLGETIVQFRTLTDAEIQEYVESGEPMDKAGAYAIQGGGARFVSRTQGSWSNVVGLPMELLARVMQSHGWYHVCR